MSTDTKCAEFTKQIEDLREYGPFDQGLSRAEVADAFEALLEIVRGQTTARPVGQGRMSMQVVAENWRASAKRWHERARSLETRVRAIGHELAQTKASMTSAQAQAQQVEEALRALLDEAQRATKRAQGETLEMCLLRDAAIKRADLAEATLATVRAAVTMPPQSKQDARPKIGDQVPWSEVEDGCLYYREGLWAPFRVVIRRRVGAMCDADDSDLTPVLTGEDGNVSVDVEGDGKLDAKGVSVLIARDLGTDPEAWRAAMREYMAKVGK